MEPLIFELPTTLLVGLELRTTQAQVHKDVAELWQHVATTGVDQQIPHLVDAPVTWACQFHWHEEHPWDYLLALEVSKIEQIPEGLACRSLGASTWASFDMPGSLQEPDILGGYALAEDWVPKSGYEWHSGISVQRYVDGAKQVELLIPLKRC